MSTASQISSTVSKILFSVKKEGDQALTRWTKALDKVSLRFEDLEVKPEEIKRAAAQVPLEVKRALEAAHENILWFHRQEIKRLSRSWKVRRKGQWLGQEIVPVKRVGVYVPGGRFSYPSTVLMTCVPAKAAGVQEIVIATPPQGVTPEVLYAARLAGAHRIFRLGGAAAIGALAFGTKRVPRVDLIAGPGNAYVTEAKRQVFGQVGIDMLAGPSEVVIVADDSPPVDWVLSDLEAQAEHDPAARATLITTSSSLAKAVRQGILKAFQSQVLVERVKTWEEARERVGKIAPEHLQIMTRRPEQLLGRPWTAGAVFVGPYSPVALGDYWAGPSHVLPTGHSARFSSGISAASFLKRSSVICYQKNALKKASGSLAALAKAEGLILHAKSVLVRSQKEMGTV